MVSAMWRLSGLLDRDLSRRAWLRSVTGTGLLSWPVLQVARSAGAAPSGTRPRSLILLWQDGGPSPFETFDPKPEAPAEYRGELGAIETRLPGVAYCEILPRLAQLADRTAIIRSLHQPSSDHVVGSHNVLTGWYDQTSNGRSRYPDLASVINHLRGVEQELGIALGASTDPRLARGMRRGGSASPRNQGHALPPYIDLGAGLHRGGPAFLGPMHGPFQVAGDPSKPGFTIQNLDATTDRERFHLRQAMLAEFERRAPADSPATAPLEVFRATEEFRQQACELLAGGRAARAFDLAREPAEVRERYGRHLAGQQCLLARRLVEAGAGVVAVRFSPDGRGDYDRTMIGWDDHAVHGNIFDIMRQRGPQFDQSVSALIEDLEARGLRDEVLLVVAGEFGRTPRIHVHKGCPGREHWGPAGCALVYGGGLTMGQVVGSTNSRGEQPQDRPTTYQDLLATIYHALGIHPAQTLINDVGRPVPLLPTGTPIVELTGPLSGPRPSAVAATPTFPVRVPGEAVHSSDAQQTTADLIALRWDDRPLAEIRWGELTRHPGLQRLSLAGSPVRDEDLAHLVRLEELTELGLSGTQVTDAGLRHLAPLRRLTRLEIQGSGISLPGVVSLFVEQQGRTLVEALRALGLAQGDAEGRLLAVDVAGTTFGDAELRRLGSQPVLRELHLAATQVTDAGLEALGSQPALERLFLAKCAITDEGLRHLGRCPRLATLNLVGTRITSAGLEHLAQLSGLRHLLITDLKLAPAAVDRLKSLCPNLVVTDYTPA
jgi:hypothetical protein